VRKPSRQAGKHRDWSVRKTRIRDRDVAPVKPRLWRIVTSKNEGAGVVNDRVAARMRPGSSTGRAARSRPDAGPRLSDGRPGPQRDGNDGRTVRTSPDMTRPRPEADRESTPTSAGSHPWSRLAIDDPSSPATSRSEKRPSRFPCVRKNFAMVHPDRRRCGEIRTGSALKLSRDDRRS
jgi:hypothetical protein